MQSSRLFLPCLLEVTYFRLQLAANKFRLRLGWKITRVKKFKIELNKNTSLCAFECHTSMIKNKLTQEFTAYFPIRIACSFKRSFFHILWTASIYGTNIFVIRLLHRSVFVISIFVIWPGKCVFKFIHRRWRNLRIWSNSLSTIRNAIVKK